MDGLLICIIFALSGIWKKSCIVEFIQVFQYILCIKCGIGIEGLIFGIIVFYLLQEEP